MNTLSIGQLARRAGVGVETVRFYEREGLLEEPPRRASGYRQYSEQVVQRLHFIQRAKLLGFSLKEISELLRLRVDAQTSCDKVKQRTEAKIAEVERKLVELQRMRQALLQVASLCTGPGPTGACPILEALNQQEPLDRAAQNKEGSRLEHLARALREAGIRQAFTPDVSRLAVRLLREVARGDPVSPQRVEQLASALDIEQQTAHEVLDKMCERDGEGNVVGIAGLSQHQHPHHFTVNGTRLATWCAWDSLFLPVLLQQTAEVSSSCPTTGETIRLTITPQGVTSYQPTSAVISIVIPQPTKHGLESVEEIWTTFCHHVHFFASPQAAQEWVATRGQQIDILTIEEAFELGRLTLSEVLQYISGDVRVAIEDEKRSMQ